MRPQVRVKCQTHASDIGHRTSGIGAQDRCSEPIHLSDELCVWTEVLPGDEGLPNHWCQRDVTLLLNFRNCKHNSDNSIRGTTRTADDRKYRMQNWVDQQRGQPNRTTVQQSNGQEVEPGAWQGGWELTGRARFCFVEQLMNHLMGNGIPRTSACVRWTEVRLWLAAVLSIDF